MSQKGGPTLSRFYTKGHLIGGAEWRQSPPEGQTEQPTGLLPDCGLSQRECGKGG